MRAVMHLLKRVLNHVAVSPAEAGDQREILLLGSSRFPSPSERPGASVAIGFSQKTCLLASMQARKMRGAEAGRRGEQHHIHAAVDHFLISVETEKLTRRLRPSLFPGEPNTP